MITSGTDPVITPGFRFYPTEEELLGFYLRHRLANTRPDVERVIPVLDVYSYHPSDLLSMAGEASVGDTEQWFFFCPRGEREVHGGRPARTTPSGYWKATGSPSHVFSSANQMIGVRRTMVFYQGRAPAGTKTKWKMNEYKATVDEASGVPATPLRLRNEFSICRVYISNGTLRSFDRRPPNASCNDHQPAQQEEASSRNPAIAGKGSAAEMDVGVPAGEEGAVDWNSLTDYFSLDFDCNWGGAWPI